MNVIRRIRMWMRGILSRKRRNPKSASTEEANGRERGIDFLRGLLPLAVSIMAMVLASAFLIRCDVWPVAPWIVPNSWCETPWQDIIRHISVGASVGFGTLMIMEVVGMVLAQLFRKQQEQDRWQREQDRRQQEHDRRQQEQDRRQQELEAFIATLLETLVAENREFIKYAEDRRREDMERIEDRWRREDEARRREDAERRREDEARRREDAERRREDSERMERILIAVLDRQASNGNSGGDSEDS